MGMMLLWSTHAAFVMLVYTALVGCLARLSRPALRWILFGLLVALGLAIYGSLAFAAGYARFGFGMAHMPFAFAASLLGAFLIASAWCAAMLARRQDDRPLAATWPRRRLAGAALLMLGFQTLVFWLLDLSVQHRFALYKLEAGAVALAITPSRPAEIDNAARLYRQAFTRLESNSAAWPDVASEIIGGRRSVDLDDKLLLDFLSSQSETLELIHQATVKPRCDFEHNYQNPLEFVLDEVQGMRQAANLLALDARVQLARGDIEAAARNIGALDRLAQHQAEEPLLISGLVAAAISQQADAMAIALLGAEKLTASDLDSFKLGDGVPFSAVCRRAMQMEEAFGMSMANMIANPAPGENGLNELTGGGVDKGLPSQPLSHLAFGIYRVFLFDNEIAVYRRLMHRMQSLADKPPYQSHGEIKQLQESVETNQYGIFASLLLPALTRAGDGLHAADTRRQLTRLAIAAKRFELDNGKLPAALDELAPRYIDQVPIDPFDGKFLKLAQDPTTWKVYSAGRKDQSLEIEVVLDK